MQVFESTLVVIIGCLSSVLSAGPYYYGVQQPQYNQYQQPLYSFAPNPFQYSGTTGGGGSGRGGGEVPGYSIQHLPLVQEHHIYEPSSATGEGGSGGLGGTGYDYTPPQPPSAYAADQAHCEQDGPLRAIAVIKGEKVNGNVTLSQKSCTDQLLIQVSLTGLPPGLHGFHVHEKGDLSGGCLSTGAHYNPDKLDHGGIHDQIRHVGDWGNVVADENGNVYTQFHESVASLYGHRSIVGRAIVVHDGEDDLGKTDHPDSKKTGNAGGRAGCGVIGILDELDEIDWYCNASWSLKAGFGLMALNFFAVVFLERHR